MESATRLGLDGLLGGRSEEPIRRFAWFDWGGLVERIQGALAREDVELVVTQPPQASRQRFYVHVLSRQGTRLAFAKVSADEGNDLKLRRESEVLARIAKTEPRTFRVPVVLDDGAIGGRSFVILEPIPVRATPAQSRWSALVEEIQLEVAGPSTRLVQCEQLSWWPSFQAMSGLVPELARRAGENRRPWEVTAAHGDFTNWNLYQVNGTNWLFDWESFASDAPVLTDAVRFLIGMHTRAVEVNPRLAGLRLRRLFASLGFDESRVIQAIAFLHARGVRGAMLLAQTWQFEEKGMA